jgi:hypothetical protein
MGSMGAHLAEAVAKYLQEARSGGITTSRKSACFSSTNQLHWHTSAGIG